MFPSTVLAQGEYMVAPVQPKSITPPSAPAVAEKKPPPPPPPPAPEKKVDAAVSNDKRAEAQKADGAKAKELEGALPSKDDVEAPSSSSDAAKAPALTSPAEATPGTATVKRALSADAPAEGTPDASPEGSADAPASAQAAAVEGGDAAASDASAASDEETGFITDGSTEPSDSAESDAGGGASIDHNGVKIELGDLKEDDPLITKTKEGLDSVASTKTGSKLLEEFASGGGTVDVSTESTNGIGATANNNVLHLTPNTFGGEESATADTIAHEITHAIADEGVIGEGAAYAIGGRVQAELTGTAWSKADDQVALNLGPGNAKVEESDFEKLESLGIDMSSLDTANTGFLDAGTASQENVNAAREILKGGKIQGVLDTLGGKDGVISNKDVSAMAESITPGARVADYKVNGEDVRLTPAEAAALDYFASAGLNGTTMFDSVADEKVSVKDVNDAIANGDWKLDEITNDSNT
jgi:hypothetical protein